MFPISPSQVPDYLRSGEFFRSLDPSNDDEIQVPNDVVKSDISVSNKGELEHFLTSLRFWGVEDIPYDVITHIIFADSDDLDEKWFISFPSLILLRKLRENKDPTARHKIAIQSGNMHIIKYWTHQGIIGHDYSCVIAVRSGNFESLKYLHELGGALNAEACMAAFAGNDLNCLNYFRTHNALGQLSGRAIILTGFDRTCIILHPSIVFLNIAIEAGCIINAVTAASAGQLGHSWSAQLRYRRGLPAQSRELFEIPARGKGPPDGASGYCGGGEWSTRVLAILAREWMLDWANNLRSCKKVP